MEDLTSALRVDPLGYDEKCSVEAVELAIQHYASMSLKDASEGFSKPTKEISLDEDRRDEILERKKMT